MSKGPKVGDILIPNPLGVKIWSFLKKNQLFFVEKIDHNNYHYLKGEENRLYTEVPFGPWHIENIKTYFINIGSDISNLEIAKLLYGQ